MAKINLKDYDSQIVELKKQGYSYSNIASTLGLKEVSVKAYIMRNYPELKTLNMLRGNTSYFHTIDSYAKAYIVGFIAADGALVKHLRSIYLTITIKYEDRALLEFVQSELNDKRKLIEIKRPSSFNSSKIIHHIRFCIGSIEIAKDLMNLGITYRKSLTLTNIIENIPYVYRDAFIIGYFDGDGSVSRVSHSPHSRSLSIQIRGTYNFLQGICSHLNIPVSFIKLYDSINTLYITNKKYISRFFQCYNNLPFYYKRKYDKFIGWNIPDQRYKQVQTISSPTE